MNLSYTISITLKETLNSIEQQRMNILLSPISPEKELRLRWETMIDRIYWSFALVGNPVTKAEIVKIVGTDGKKRLRPHEHDLLGYKHGLDYIQQYWCVSNKPVTTKTLEYLYEIVFAHTRDRQIILTYRTREAEMRRLLEYLNSSDDHPVVQAAILTSQLLTTRPFGQATDRISHLTAYLFLYKTGYDCRELITLEGYWKHNFSRFAYALETVRTEQNSNRWIEFVAEGVATQLGEIVERIQAQRTTLDLSHTFFELNDRQKNLMTMLRQPNFAITNKKVQKKFGISQITASRDLAKMVTLGLLFPHGKGRSTYYTRV